MDPDALDLVVELTQGALIMTLKLSLPLLGVGLIVGLAVSLFQAVTQIQEQTLTFIPKIFAVVITLMLILPTMLIWILEYTNELFEMLPRLWGGG